LKDLPAHPIPEDVLLPAPGQGTLALETKTGSRAEALCRALDHAASARAAEIERRVVAAFGGDCTLPLAAWARPEGAEGEGGGRRMRLTGLLATPDGRRAARGEAVGEDPAELATACVAAMRADGADEVLASLGKTKKS
jgi:hydroxymethylbilane synthase